MTKWHRESQELTRYFCTDDYYVDGIINLKKTNKVTTEYTETKIQKYTSKNNKGSTKLFQTEDLM